MNYFRYLGTIGAFILFVIAIKFFNDGNMYWWSFMFAFIIVSGFLVNGDEMSCKHGKIWQSPDGEQGMEECDKCNENMDKWMKPIMDNLSKHKMTDKWYDNAHCMECGYVNKACVCKPVSGRWEVKQTDNDFTVITEEDKELPKDWEDYKATYIEDEVNDGVIIDNIVNNDADIMNNDGLSEWEVTKSEEAERADKRLRDEMNVLTVIDDDIPF